MYWRSKILSELSRMKICMGSERRSTNVQELFCRFGFLNSCVAWQDCFTLQGIIATIQRNEQYLSFFWVVDTIPCLPAGKPLFMWVENNEWGEISGRFRGPPRFLSSRGGSNTIYWTGQIKSSEDAS